MSFDLLRTALDLPASTLSSVLARPKPDAWPEALPWPLDDHTVSELSPATIRRCLQTAKTVLPAVALAVALALPLGARGLAPTDGPWHLAEGGERAPDRGGISVHGPRSDQVWHLAEGGEYAPEPADPSARA